MVWKHLREMDGGKKQGGGGRDGEIKERGRHKEPTTCTPSKAVASSAKQGRGSWPLLSQKTVLVV